jgi:hypothetical protein
MNGQFGLAVSTLIALSACWEGQSVSYWSGLWLSVDWVGSQPRQAAYPLRVPWSKASNAKFMSFACPSSWQAFHFLWKWKSRCSIQCSIQCSMALLQTCFSSLYVFQGFRFTECCNLANSSETRENQEITGHREITCIHMPCCGAIVEPTFTWLHPYCMNTQRRYMRDCDRFRFELMLPKVAKNLDLLSLCMYMFI